MGTLEIPAGLDFDAGRSLEGLVVDGGKGGGVVSLVVRPPLHQHRLFARGRRRGRARRLGRGRGGRRRGGRRGTRIDATARNLETPHFLIWGGQKKS